MRRPPLLAILIVLPTLAPLSMAEPSADALLTDPAGDVQWYVQGSPATTSPSPLFEGLDVRALAITEDLEHIIFHVTFEDIQEDGMALIDSATAIIEVFHGLERYEVHADWNLYAMTAAGEEPAVGGTFVKCDPPSCSFQSVDAAVDLEAQTISVFVPRTLMPDEAAAYPFPGSELTGLWVRTTNTFSNLPADFVAAFGSLVAPMGTLYEVRDDMGTDAPATYVIQQGGGDVEGLSLHLLAPTRLSNGEATTLLFEPELVNLQERPITVQFAAEGVPRQWDVWFPAQGVEVAPRANLTVPVLVSMPFAHQHGERHEIGLMARAADDATIRGSTTIAVQVTDIPQPAGHHDRLWLHARPAALFAINDVRLFEHEADYWNTLEEDGTGEAAAASSEPVEGYGVVPLWRGPLSPGLGMGLDIDEAGEGVGHFVVESDRPLSAVQMMGQVVHESQTGVRTIVATIEDTGEAQALLAGGTATFEARVLPGDVDRIPYAGMSNLWVELWLTQSQDLQEIGWILTDDYAYVVRMQSGSYLDLPLLEYHDDVSEAYSSLQQVRLVAASQELPVNAGETTVFDVTLFNNGPDTARYWITAGGPNAAAATLSTDRLEVARGGDGTFRVALAAPDDALDGDLVDVFVEATRIDDASVKALLRLVARVDSDEDHPDLAGIVAAEGPDRDAPLPVVAALLAIAGASVFRRRI